MAVAVGRRVDQAEEPLGRTGNRRVGAIPILGANVDGWGNRQSRAP